MKRGQLELLGPGLAVFHSFGNVGFVYGHGEMLAVDTGGRGRGVHAIGAIRKITPEPLKLIVYTHGHHDHTSDTPYFVRDAAARGYPKPQIWSHEAVPARFRRYMKLAGWEAHINSLQFDTRVTSERVRARNSYTFPDFTYRNHCRLELAGEPVELHHARGETEDATWVWLPERAAALVGDLILSSMPNAGNPTKPQRFTEDWVEALERIAAKKPRFVLTGHGPAYRGPACRVVLLDTAAALRYINDEVVRRLNRGDWPIDIMEADIKLPPSLAGKSHLREIYGCVPFVIRDVIRGCSGWWSGKPSELFPPGRREHAEDIVGLCGRDALLVRICALLQRGKAERAVALAEILSTADLADPRARRLYAQSLEQLAKRKKSFIARNLLRGMASRVRGGE